MAAPTPTAPQAPSGRKLGDGYRTSITLSLAPTIALWVKSVTPPGLEGDEPNDTTTMENDKYRTKSPRALQTMTDMTYTCAWDPIVYSTIDDYINISQTITITFPDRSTVCFYGIVRSFMPGELVEGTQPEATVTITPTNQDPTTCEEEGPVYTAGTGTAPC